jgi:hypothetical protein
VHCVKACGERAEWLYPPAPHRVTSDVVYDLLKHRMGCTDEEVAAFGFEDPRCWFRSTDDGYLGLEASMDYLAELCTRERPDGIAGYSNGAGAALLVAAARESGHEAFQSIRFLMSFAGRHHPRSSNTSAICSALLASALPCRRSSLALAAIPCS